VEKIGFIGLGTMGKPMARNLMKAGYPLTVSTRTRAKAEDLIGEGCTWADTPRAVAELSDVVITMLPDSPDVELVMAGKNGIFDGGRSGLLLIDMSTISPVVARKLAGEAELRGMEMLDAPVSGGDIGAVNGTLSIMVGGKEAAFNRALPVFQAMGKTILHIGDTGAGQICKAANQIITSINMAAISEALVFAAKAGADPAKVRQALLGGAAQSKNLEIHGQRMLDRNFKPGFRLVLHRKDVEIALAAAREYGVPLVVTSTIHEMMNASIVAGRGEMDMSSTVLLVEEWAKTELNPGRSATVLQ
jgi:2-hydroxy-3-oxopropionate reductase